MRKVLFILIQIITFNTLSSQNILIEYKRKANIEFQTKSISNKLTRDRVAKQLLRDSVLFSLHGNSKSSLFVRLRQTKTNNNDSHMNIGLRDSLYINYRTNKITYKSNFEDGVIYIVENGLYDYDWRLTGKEKMILGYTCKQIKAKYRNDGDRYIFAWYSAELPFSVGPEEYITNLGAILEVSNDNFNYQAVMINRNSEDNKIIKPSFGKKISQDLYNKKLNELRKSLVFRN